MFGTQARRFYKLYVIMLELESVWVFLALLSFLFFLYSFDQHLS